MSGSSIAAAKISLDAFRDLMEMMLSQPWLEEVESELVDLWNICENREEQNLLRELIKKFYILDAKKVSKACAAIKDKVEEWGLKSTDTWIVAVANDEEPDGSILGLQLLKNKILPVEDWHSRYISNIPAASKKIEIGNSVILFDDFVGSGGKFVRKRNWLNKFLQKKGFSIDDINLYFVSFSGMSFGLKHVEEETQCKIYSFVHLKKAISESYPEDEAKIHIETMKGIENKLSENYQNKKLSKYSLGFNGSESLYCAENDNCPNNVFPIFWWPNLKNGLKLRTIKKRAG